jgi:hypothetical protein
MRLTAEIADSTCGDAYTGDIPGLSETVCALSVAMRKFPRGQVGVPAGGQLKSPSLADRVVLGVEARAATVAVSASHRTARGASIEVCEGTDGHHFGLPRGGYLVRQRPFGS